VAFRWVMVLGDFVAMQRINEAAPLTVMAMRRANDESRLQTSLVSVSAPPGHALERAARS